MMPAATVELDREAVLREYARRGLLRERVLGPLFDRQRAFVDDPAKRKAASCSRRAGKTVAVARCLLARLAVNPGALAAYVTDTRGHAKELMWEPLKKLCREAGLAHRVNETELILMLDNGSRVRLTGADGEADINKLRGFAFDLVVIDEAQNLSRHMMRLIDDVLEMALLDRDGQLMLTGTPNASCSGEFCEVATGARTGWSAHRWTLVDNPHLPHAAEYLNRLRADKGWAIDHPTYRREALGEWVRDDTALVYRFREDRNLAEFLPAGDWLYVLGIDLGFHPDPCAFVVWAWSLRDGRAYAVHAETRAGWTPSDIGRRCQELDAQYAFAAMVADAGALGKMIVAEVNQRFGLSLIAAVKTEKWAHIELLNADLEEGRALALPEAAALTEEWRLLLKDLSGPTPVEMAGMANHCADAALYAWRYCRAHLFAPAEAAPEPGSVAWLEAEARRMEREEADRMVRRNRGEMEFNEGDEGWLWD